MPLSVCGRAAAREGVRQAGDREATIKPETLHRPFIMIAFFREMLVAMKEGPAIFFAPVRAAVRMARSPARHSDG